MILKKMPLHVLFVCIHNSARSQMAEAYLEFFGGKKYSVHSAGLEQGALNPLVVEIMQEDGIDISQKQANTVQEYLEKNMPFDYVITVCDESNAEKCPLFPGNAQRLHWGFKDPSSLEGSLEEKQKVTRIIREEIKGKVRNWVTEMHLLS